MQGIRLEPKPGATAPPEKTDPPSGRRLLPDVVVRNPGEYMKRPDGTGWDGMTPGGERCFFHAGDVTELADGSITVGEIVVLKPRPVLDADGKPVLEDGKPKVDMVERWRGSITAGTWSKA